jgi:GNAT superfamily N-acetyltransferase
VKTLSFRQATPSDAGAIASVHTENWREAYRGILPDAYLKGPVVSDRLNLWRARFASPGADRHFVLLAESEMELAGFVCLLLDEEPQWGACLDNLHVLPCWRGKGIGRALFGRAARWVVSVEPGWGMHLWVLEANLDARRFYEALGGELVERRPKEVVAGIIVPSVRYAWHDLAELENIGGAIR